VHARNGHISTSSLKSDVTTVFINPDFLYDMEILVIPPLNKGYIAYFSLHMRDRAIFLLVV